MKRTSAALSIGMALGVPAAAQTVVQELPGRTPGSVVARMPVMGPGLRPVRPGPTADPRDGTWQRMTAPPGVFVRAISMGSANIGFAAAELGIVLRSRDGGNTWQTILNEGFPIYYYGVHAFNEQTVVVTGFNNAANTGVFRWSDNGGDTWGPVQTLNPNSPIRWLYFVNFADSAHGVIQAAIGTHYTTNGGRTAADWTFVRPSDNWFQGPFTFLSDLRVWMTGYDNFRSINGVMTWTPLPRANPVFDGPHAFTPDNHGFVGGGSISPTVAGWLYSSSNGGDSWSAQPVLQTAYPIRAILKLDGQRAWAVGGNYFSGVGGIWGTSDGGQTWTLEQDTGAELVDVQMVGGPGQVDVYAAGMVSQIWRLRMFIDCYANCDGSTGAPVLNVNDFVCFQTRFAAGEAYANCDGSTMAPVLNVNDFVCFQTQFAAGCP